MARITYARPTGDFDLKQAIQTAVTGQVTESFGATVTYQQGAYTAELLQAGGRTLGATYSKDGEVYVSVSMFSADASFANPDSVFAGEDSYTGSEGNDHFYGSAGNDYYMGRNGIDTVHYAGTKNDYTVEGIKLTAPNKTDFLNGIERVHFEADGSTLALDVGAGQNAGAAYRLYEAAFDRKADTAGLNYWTGELDTGKSLQQVAQGFVDSAEFKALNPGSDPNSLINSLYLHVLDREADAPGLQYWNEQVNAGLGINDVLVSLSESAENINKLATELSNGVWLT